MPADEALHEARGRPGNRQRQRIRFLQVDFGPETHCIIGGPSAGDMIGEVALAIAMGRNAADCGKPSHPHPTLDQRN